MSNYRYSQYVPSFLREQSLNSARSFSLSYSNFSGSNIQNPDSFGYDVNGTGLKSSQQLNVDWSKFENHTFFMSAEAKVNLTFEQIINGFPFDGTREEVENFFTDLSGFDKWVFDRFPKYQGQLHFSGTQTTETLPTLGTYIQVKDIQGVIFPSLSPNADAQVSTLNPKNNNSLSIELQLKIPKIQTNGTQILLQKINHDKNHGFSIRLNPIASTNYSIAQFDVFSGSLAMSTSATIEKGIFNHLCFVLDRDSKLQNLKIFNNESIISTTTGSTTIGNLSIDYNDLLIGSGTSYYVEGNLVTPRQTLSGTIDELRIFHSFRTTSQQKSYAKKSIHSAPDLKLYYKFNEPAPPLSPITDDITNSIVLDSSGNSLHSFISNFSGFLRENAKNDPLSNLIYERNDLSPVLFPAYQDVINLNVELLTSASAYDLENPNIITKLIPRHYLVEGAAAEGLTSAEANNGSQYGGSGIPGQGKLNNVQIMLSLLYIWAKFFDEIKLFLDAFSSLKTVDYELNKSIPNNMLFDIAKHYGFFLPPLFTSATIDQYVLAENIDPLIKGNESLSLRSVQHEILRRILINLPSIIRSKGTQQSIKAFLRSIGIEPDSSVRFREYGGPTYRKLLHAKESKSDLTTIINFSSSSLVTSQFLSSSRLQPGYPKPEGTFVQKHIYNPHGISNSINDGLLTSGSWTFECNYKYELPISLSSFTQSLARLCVTGSGIQNPGLVANLIGYYDENDPKVRLFLRPGNDDNAPLLDMTLNLPTGSLFNGDIWNVSFGCERNDSIDSIASSSYFIRVGTQNEGEVLYSSTTSSYFYELTGSGSPLDSNVFRKLDLVYQTNVSGAFITLGSNQTIPEGSTSTYRFLNNNLSVAESVSRKTAFDGRALRLKFWSKALSENEWLSHLTNYQSLGVDNPLVNYNYSISESGSYERLRLESLVKQEIKSADNNGNITFLDFSENGINLNGTGFPANKNCMLPEIIRYSHLSAYFDEAVTNEKVRVRGYNDEYLISRNEWARPSPVYEITRSETPQDDARFSIDFSLVDSLNKDIINMFSTFESMENYLGNPELVFSSDYPDLEKLRSIYFNRLKDKLNFKAFMEFYSWFDNSISTFIEQLMPKKTMYKGTNFVIESHMLERHKIEYFFSENYVKQNKRRIIHEGNL